ncbi:hypothetical protein M408DRAFT_295577 [Serendipita vermifera MAFF 305830]|uniref:Uncharacterized protein n=1 Tax=Serendipita vermifera MAFF 305830 TaxID=933852 RepID=A0A0C2XMQ2_SERVB|nr:hypothetical protein M408DRAFT_295577 [Serendipita vermifera MAFF 305830]
MSTFSQPCLSRDPPRDQPSAREEQFDLFKLSRTATQRRKLSHSTWSKLRHGYVEFGRSFPAPGIGIMSLGFSFYLGSAPSNG